MEKTIFYRLRIVENANMYDGDGYTQYWDMCNMKDEYFKTYEGALRKFNEIYENRETFRGINDDYEMKYTKDSIYTYLDDNEVKKISMDYEATDYGFATEYEIDLIITEETLND